MVIRKETLSIVERLSREASFIRKYQIRGHFGFTINPTSILDVTKVNKIVKNMDNPSITSSIWIARKTR